MTTATTADQVERVLKPIQQFVRGWMTGPLTDRRAADLGLQSGSDLWIVGRAGVLGDGDADVAAAGLAFLGPERVRAAWDSLPNGLTPRRVADAYTDLCCAWGSSQLARFDESRMKRLDELGRCIADRADGSIGTVFAGWRAQPQPADVNARVALTMHVLRELRGGAHIVAILACGLTPLDAVLASPAAPPRTGAVWAEHLGWTGPFDDPAQFRERRMEAERLTSRVLEPIYASIGDAALAEFAELVETTRNAIDM
ncbi:MAG: SCO6745 family protein [Ilumatobacteraceae bacterium]